MSLTVVIPTLNAANTLEATLDSVGWPADIVVVDGGSDDGTLVIARAAGARVIEMNKSRGAQLSAGAQAAPGDWLLFLHADTRLQYGWEREVADFAARPDSKERAATFRFALDHGSPRARWLERMVMWRCRVLRLPYGDQGLLIHRDFYRQLGGYRSLPIMEDVDLILRIGRSRLVILPVAAQTSAVRWIKAGWTRRSIHNLFCLTLYFLGVPPRIIGRIYD